MNSEIQKNLISVIEKTLEENKIQHFDENSSKQQLLEELSIYYRELEFQNDELRVTQNNLEQTRDELSELIENAPVGYVVFTEDYYIVSTNKYFEKLIQVEKKCLKDTSLRNYIQSSTQDNFYLHFEQLKKQKKSDTVELKLLSNNSVKNVKIESTCHEKNGLMLYMSAFTDISEQKQAQLALSVSQLDLQNIVSNSPNHIWKFDGRFFTFINLAMQSFLGLKNVSRIDFSLWKYSIHPDDLELFMQIWNNALSNRMPFDFEIRLKNSSNKYQSFWCRAVPVFDESYQFEYFQGYNVDISDRISIENELRQSEEKYRIIAENTSDGIFIVDARQFITYASPVFLQSLKNSDLTVSNRRLNYFQLIHLSERDNIKTAFDYAINQKKEDLIYNYKINCENNEYCWKEDHVKFKYDAVGKYTHAFIVSRDITERKKNEAKIWEYQKDLKNYAGHLQSINEEERTNLAREIHDEMSQILIALKIEVGILKNEISKNYELASMQKTVVAFAKITEMVDNTLKSTLRIISGLRPDVIEILGFVDTIQAYFTEYGERHNIQTVFSTNIDKIELKPHVELSLFRVLQEALMNTARHSKASKVTVDIKHDNRYVTMSIFDNGIGFNLESNKKGNTYGMIGMKERVSILNGELKIESGPGFGTLITVEIPLNN